MNDFVKKAIFYAFLISFGTKLKCMNSMDGILSEVKKLRENNKKSEEYYKNNCREIKKKEPPKVGKSTKKSRFNPKEIKMDEQSSEYGWFSEINEGWHPYVKNFLKIAGFK